MKSDASPKLEPGFGAAFASANVFAFQHVPLCRYRRLCLDLLTSHFEANVDRIRHSYVRVTGDEVKFLVAKPGAKRERARFLLWG